MSGSTRPARGRTTMTPSRAGGDERVLTLRELNRATLARQMLLARAPLTPRTMIERLVGMQAQSPRSPYIGIWTRATRFERAALERALRRRTIVKATVMRMTLHLVTRRDYGLLRAALSETNFYEQTPVASRLAPAVRALATDGPVTAGDVMAYLAREHGLTGRDARYAWRGARVRAHVLPHQESALWHAGRDDRYVAFDEPEPHDPTDARAETLRRYLAAFGPASARDMVAWSMMRVPEISRALARLELVRLHDERGRALLDVPDGLFVDGETPAPVRFLPKWDNVLLAWADRGRVLPEAHRKRVIKMNGDVAPTFLVDGFVAGTWRFEDGHVRVDPFAELPRSARRELDDETARLEAFLIA